MKFIEEQLRSLLKETPHDTECSVSGAVLDGFGIRGLGLQANWLEMQRPAEGEKSWRFDGERWGYGVGPPVALRKESIEPSSAANWRTTFAPPDRVQPIVVKPLAPLRK